MVQDLYEDKGVSPSTFGQAAEGKMESGTKLGLQNRKLGDGTAGRR